MATKYQDLGYDKILVALDGTEQQRDVLKHAIIVAANNDSELYIGHVIDSSALETAGAYPKSVIENLEKEFREAIADLVEEAQKIETIEKVEIIVETGRIRETLKDDMIDVIKPDLVICGARGLSSIRYAILGSISTFLVRNANCDTLVLK